MILLGFPCLPVFTQHTGTMYIRSASSPNTVLWAFHTIQPSSFCHIFYRAIHYSAQRDTAVSCLSVCYIRALSLNTLMFSENNNTTNQLTEIAHRFVLLIGLTLGEHLQMLGEIREVCTKVTIYKTSDISETKQSRAKVTSEQGPALRVFCVRIESRIESAVRFDFESNFRIESAVDTANI